MAETTRSRRVSPWPQEAMYSMAAPTPASAAWFKVPVSIR